MSPAELKADRRLRLQVPRLSQGSELPYVFGAPLVYEYKLGYFSGPWSDEQRTLSEAVMTYWTNFAKSGYVWDGPPVIGHSY